MNFLISILVLAIYFVQSHAGDDENPPEKRDQDFRLGLGRDLTKRIVGGEVVERGAAKFSASLWYMVPNPFTENTGLNHVCGGTLIAPRWVLTSAHCFDDRVLPGLSVLSDFLVVLGENNQNLTEPGEQFFSIESITNSPLYDLSIPTGDVALLKLNASARMDDYTATIGLDDDPNCAAEGATCTVYGWGQAEEEPYGYGTVLPYETDVMLWNNGDCIAAYNGTGFHIGELELCAKGDGKDACSGDSGGPLVCTCNGEAVVSGVVFTGKGCAHDDYPGVYERVVKFAAWIRDTMAG